MDIYACIKNNIIDNIIIFDNPEQQELDNYKELFNLDLLVKVDDLSKELACPGGTYTIEDGFIPLPQYPSWIWNKELSVHVPPIEIPTLSQEDFENNKCYIWDEESISWKLINL